MRGKVLVAVQSQTDGGITPAYAGKRLRSLRSAPARGDHPRLCGEKLSRLGMGLGKTGSPPPMRGKDNLCRKTVQRTRITPAYAGKRRTIQGVRDQIEDHPRLCGEKLLLCEHCGKPIGSPPPMRGKESSVQPAACTGGITPAYAGKRS